MLIIAAIVRESIWRPKFLEYQNFIIFELPLNIVQFCSYFAWIFISYIGTKWEGKKIIFKKFKNKLHPNI